MNASSLMPATTVALKPSAFIQWNINYLQQQIGFYLGLVLYIFYIFLIGTQTTKAMNPYKKVLALNCTLDLLFIVNNLILHGEFPCLITDKGLKCFRLVTAIFVYPPSWIVWLSEVINKTSIGWHVPGVAVTFLYRYFLICRNYQFPMWLFLIAALVSIGIPFTIYITMDGYYTRPKDDDAYYGQYFHKPEYEYDGRYPSFIVTSIGLSAVDSIGYIMPSYFAYPIIFFTTYRINRTLSSLKNRSNRMKRMQAEMTIVQWIQAVIPFISFIIPFTSIVAVSIFNLDKGFIFYFTKASIWAPAINVTLSIIVIGPYRRYMKGFFRYCFKNQEERGSSEGGVSTVVTHVSRQTKVVAN